MSEIYPQDITLAIETRLKDNTNGVAAQINTINTNRSQSTPVIEDEAINSYDIENYNPVIYIDYESSDIGDYLGGGNIRKTCKITVECIITTADLGNIKKYASNYIEAITKCLHDYDTGDITAIFAESDIIDNLDMQELQKTKVVGVRFNVLINGGA